MGRIPAGQLSPELMLARLEAAVTDFGAVLAHGDLEAPVPGCPRWRLRELALHLGDVHHWAAGALLTGRKDTPEPEPPPPGRAALAAWSARYAAELLDALRSVPPDRPCWGFGPPPRTAAFWYRRQLHETALHAWDAASSQGETAPLEPWLAADGIDEVVTMFYPRQVRLGRTAALARSLGLHPDGERLWRLGGPPGGEPDAVLSGPAATLLLLVWGRLTLDDALRDPDAGTAVTLSGDGAAARAVLAAEVTP